MTLLVDHKHDPWESSKWALPEVKSNKVGVNHWPNSASQLTCWSLNTKERLTMQKEIYGISISHVDIIFSTEWHMLLRPKNMSCPLRQRDDLPNGMDIPNQFWCVAILDSQQELLRLCSTTEYWAWQAHRDMHMQINDAKVKLVSNILQNYCDSKILLLLMGNTQGRNGIGLSLVVEGNFFFPNSKKKPRTFTLQNIGVWKPNRCAECICVIPNCTHVHPLTARKSHHLQEKL